MIAFEILIIVAVLVFCMGLFFIQNNKNKRANIQLCILVNISDIDKKYVYPNYKIGKYYESIAERKEIFIEEKNGEQLIYKSFILCPLYSNTRVFNHSTENGPMIFENGELGYREILGPINNTIYAYVGYCFEKAIHGEIKDSEKESAKGIFMEQAASKCYEMSYKNKIEYFERVDSGYHYDQYIRALNTNNKPIIFTPQFVPFMFQHISE